MAFPKLFAALVAFALLSLVSARKFDHCKSAFRNCDFQIKGRGLQTFYLPARPDKAFTPDIITKNRRKLIGVVNTNLEIEFVQPNGDVVRATRKIPKSSGVQPFTPNVFKSFFPSKGGMFSGIGHETFQKGQLEFAKGMCVRVFLTEYQVLNPHTKAVLSNVNDQKFRGKNCVVFRTA